VKVRGLKKPPHKVFSFKEEIDLKEKGRIRALIKFDCRPRSFLQSFPNGSSVKMDVQFMWPSGDGAKLHSTNFGPVEFRFNPNNSTPKRGKFWVLTPFKSANNDCQFSYVLGQHFSKVIRVFFDSIEAEVSPPMGDDKSSYSSWRQVKVPSLEDVNRGCSNSHYVATVRIQQKTRKGKWEDVEGTHKFTYERRLSPRQLQPPAAQQPNINPNATPYVLGHQRQTASQSQHAVSLQLQPPVAMAQPEQPMNPASFSYDEYPPLFECMPLEDTIY